MLSLSLCIRLSCDQHVFWLVAVLPSLRVAEVSVLSININLSMSLVDSKERRVWPPIVEPHLDA